MSSWICYQSSYSADRDCHCPCYRSSAVCTVTDSIKEAAQWPSTKYILTSTCYLPGCGLIVRLWNTQDKLLFISLCLSRFFSGEEFKLAANSLGAHIEIHGGLILRTLSSQWTHKMSSHCEFAVSLPWVCNSHRELAVSYSWDHPD